MSLATDLVDNANDLCPHGRVICGVCADEEEDEDESFEYGEDDN